ncbi:ComEA family DNA-binding protein [Protaetiibacter sp. SSC-01]|uniref:ComEA family DNA-binding protein n=1 Tax=Protaetiibacter sp. SSC-01 TaxID=2759943 RepID=UPI001656D853|nr:ComEA family DNA-binding protein [Protaetiibacter sp. SSC-01]QNO36667.1 ComEA family DNA-binding protein [Protaetiibacter sp. SSC-01]
MSVRPDPSTQRARVRRGVGAALVVLLAGAAVAVFVTAITPRGAERTVAPDGSPDALADPALVASASESPIFIHVLGQVERPGLYELREGARVIDAVSAAGGLTDGADPAGVNLARVIADGEQLLVPAVGEVPPSAVGTSSDGRVDLNTADVSTLDTLPRIGPAMAQRIVEWREANGPIRSVDDLLAVSGIGAKTVEALRPLVAP